MLMEAFAPVPKSCAKVHIKAELENHPAILHSQGLRIAEKIMSALDKGQGVEVSFKGVDIPNISFLNGLFGLIYYKYSVETLENLLYLQSIEPELQEEIDEIKWRSQNAEFHSELFETAVLGS